MTDIKIDQEFQSLIPPLTIDEYNQLEQNLITDGIRDPLVIWNGILIDGHNRYDISQKHNLEFKTIEMQFDNRDDVKIWIINNQLGRRNLLPAVRIKLAMVAEPIIAAKKKENSIANLKQNQTTDTDICRSRTPEKEISSKEKKKIERQNATNYQVAQIAGVSDKSVERYKKIQQKAAPEVVAKVDSGEMSINEGYKQVKQAEKQQRAEEKAERKSFTLEDEMPDDVCKLFQADITKGLPEIADNSVDYIITDPPYPEEFLPLYADLAILAERVLKPGGSLICMCGQSYLPKVLSMLTGGLTYHWCACYNTPGSAAQIYQRKIMTNWKPLLWLTKGQYKGEWCKDTFTSPANDKRFHHWGQSLGGMEDIVKTITNPNDIILDPFLGGGTTGVAAVINGRKFIGTDIEQSCIDTAMQRIKEAYDYVKRGENGLA